MRASRAIAAAATALAAAIVVGCTPGARPAAPRGVAIQPWNDETSTAQPDPSQATSAGQEIGRISGAQAAALTTRVRLIGVGFAGEGGYIIARFTAPPRLAGNWQPARMYVLDEATGSKYDEIPQMPLIGPLMGRPVKDGQVGYVMFVNTASRLKKGARVTVVLDTFSERHVVVK